MGGGRAPCCDKTKVRTGPWSPAEDLRLITFIQKYGHTNWRALPKQAGLLRCGKSCRLRWINYLRPDVKRGNFTLDEENTILRLHHSFGNKWSKIATYLPGRTDNEIKNVWNTHLKKRVLLHQEEIEKHPKKAPSSSSGNETALQASKTQEVEGEIEMGKWLRLLEDELGLSSEDLHQEAEAEAEEEIELVDWASASWWSPTHLGI